MSPATDLSCVVHVHSTFSDGTATVPEIVAAADQTGRDAVLLTDHDSMEARDRGFEGYNGSVLVVVGLEVSPRGGHLLAFGLDRKIEHDGLSETEIARRARDSGALTFAAHPFSTGSAMSRRIGRPHPWPDVEAAASPGDAGVPAGAHLTGIELWSLVTDAAESWRSPRDALSFLRDPLEGSNGPPAPAMQAWDRLGAERRIVALGGLDAHQSGIRIGSRVLSPMPHGRYFGLLGTHIQLPEPPSGDDQADVRAVLDSLRQGRCYLGLDGLAPARGFRFWAEDEDGRLEMGGEAGAGRWRLRVESPREAEMVLIRDGEPVMQGQGRSLDADASRPGVYRVEARLRHRCRPRLWIISNPIYLRSRDGR